MNNQRNNSIDILKTVCSFMVVFIHAGENNTLGTYLKVICTCAVPFFFLVSGYYLSSNITAEKKEYFPRQLKKIGRLFLSTNILYAIYVSILMLLFHSDLAGFWKNALSCESIISFVFLNESPFAYHLWYIGAILYAFFVFYLLLSIFKNKTGKVIIYMSFLLFFSISIGVYSKLFFGRSFPIYVSRNFISVGIPSMAIGYMLHSVINKYHHLHRYALLSIIVFLIAIILERFILHRLGCLSKGSYFIMTFPLAVSMFLFVATDGQKYTSSIMKALANIGHRDSANLYLYHILFVFLLDYLIASKNAVYLHIKPLLIFVMTLTFSRGLQFTQNMFLRRKQ